MNWYLKVLKQYADFKGRARRKEYWMFVLFNAIIGWALQGIFLATDIKIFEFASMAYSLALFIPGLAVLVRRLHDIGKSGWMFFIILIPAVGIIWLLVLLCTNGEEGSNDYGQDPKNPNDELEEIGIAEA
ncbi:DUF805 domain-containing protein [Wenyingzhuangia sp. IMCC45574]